MHRFDIAPSSLPNTTSGEYWFEETRDFREVVVRFRASVPPRIGLDYWRNRWPQVRVEERGGDLPQGDSVEAGNRQSERKRHCEER